MNSLIETLNRWGGRIPDFAWPMLWQSSVLIAVLFVFDFVARRRVRASVRYALWLLVLVKLLLPPTLALPTSLAWWVRPPATQAKPEARTTTFVVTYGDFVPANFPTSAPPFLVPPPKPSLSGAGRTAATWVAVGIGLLVWLVARWRKVASDVHKAIVAPESLSETLDEARLCIKLPRRVRLLVSKRAMSPAVCGLFRPVILLPQPLVERLTPSQLRAVLLHELAHLRRGDVWVNCVQALLQIFYWWHPLLWLANARIRRVREEAVDDAVMLALADERETYAPTLLEVAKLAFNRPLASLGLVGILESRSALRQRIERLVDFRPPRKAGLTIASALSVLAFAVLAVPMEQAPATSATQDSTQKQSTSVSPPPVEPSNDNEEVKLRMIVLNKPVGGDAAPIRKLAEAIIAKIKGGTPFSEMASVYSEGRQGREGGDWGWVQKYDHDGALVLRKELADAAFSLKPGEVSGIIETPEAIYVMLVEDRRPAHTKSPSAQDRKPLPNAPERLQSDHDRKIEAVKHATPPSTNSRTATNLVFTGTGRQAIVSKLDRLRLDSVFFDEVPLGEVVLWLKDEARARDPESKGINFIINPNAGSPVQQVDPTTGLPVAAPGPSDIKSLPITINPTLTDVRLTDVLDAIVNAADKRIKYSIEDYAVVFSFRGPDVEPLYVRVFQVDTKALHEQLERVTGSSLDKLFQSPDKQSPLFMPGVDPQEGESIRNPRTLPPDLPQRRERGGLTFITRTNSMQLVSVAMATFFSTLGVDLASPSALALGKSIFWKDRTGTLLVRATKQDLDAIERGLADLAAKPASTTNPRAAPRVGTNRPPSNPRSGNDRSRLEALTNRVPVLGDIPLVGKLFRSESNASPAKAPQILIRARFVDVEQGDIDALGFDWSTGNYLLAKRGATNSNAGASPQFHDVLTDPQFRVLLRALEQREGSDILAAPAVTTVSGRQVQIQAVDLKLVVTGVNLRALIPPGIISDQGVTDSIYETQSLPVGPVLDLIPNVSADGYTINMMVYPTVTEFLGYDDSTNFVPAYANGQRTNVALPLPHFRVRQMTANAAVRDGQSLVLIKPVATEIIKRPDGSTETKDVSNTQKKQLIVFITPTLVDEAGNRLHRDDKPVPAQK